MLWGILQVAAVSASLPEVLGIMWTWLIIGIRVKMVVLPTKLRADWSAATSTVALRTRVWGGLRLLERDHGLLIGGAPRYLLAEVRRLHKSLIH